MGIALDAAFRDACAAWPGVTVREEDFRAYVAEKMDSAKASRPHPAADDLGASVRAVDLYLACACARGDAAGLKAFERAYFGEIARALRRVGGAGVPPLDEVAQLVRHKLFVAEPGARPRIADYSGAGDLRSWFRVTVSRLVLNLATRPSKEIPFEDDLLASMLGVEQKSAHGLMRDAYLEAFRAAFAAAFAALGDRERALLRAAFGEGLTVEAVGKLYGVHKTTAARWIVKAHEALRDGTRAAAMESLGIDEAEYESVLRAVQSRLDLSLERYLGPLDLEDLA